MGEIFEVNYIAFQKVHLVSFLMHDFSNLKESSQYEVSKTLSSLKLGGKLVFSMQKLFKVYLRIYFVFIRKKGPRNKTLPIPLDVWVV